MAGSIKKSKKTSITLPDELHWAFKEEVLRRRLATDKEAVIQAIELWLGKASASTNPPKELSMAEVLDMLGGVQSDTSAVQASELQELEAALNTLLRFGRHTKSHALTLLAMLTQRLASLHEPQETASPTSGDSSADQIEPHPGLTALEGLAEGHREGPSDPPRDEGDVQDPPGSVPARKGPEKTATGGDH